MEKEADIKDPTEAPADSFWSVPKPEVPALFAEHIFAEQISGTPLVMGQPGAERFFDQEPAVKPNRRVPFPYSPLNHRPHPYMRPNGSLDTRVSDSWDPHSPGYDNRYDSQECTDCPVVVDPATEKRREALVGYNFEDNRRKRNHVVSPVVATPGVHYRDVVYVEPDAVKVFVEKDEESQTPKLPVLTRIKNYVMSSWIFTFLIFLLMSIAFVTWCNWN